MITGDGMTLTSGKRHLYFTIDDLSKSSQVLQRHLGSFTRAQNLPGLYLSSLKLKTTFYFNALNFG